MAGIIFPADAVSGAPNYTGEMARQTIGGLWGGRTTARPLGARSGVHPGTPSTTATVTGTGPYTWNVAPFGGVVDLEASGVAGPYNFAFATAQTGSINAADLTNPRIDLLSVLLSDPAEGDGSSAPGIVIVYTAGTAASSPAAPATPARSMPLAWLNVPHSGAGAPTASIMAPYTTATGGIVAARTSAEYPASPYVGQYVDDATHGLYRYNGTVWVPGTGAKYAYSGTPLAGAFDSTKPVNFQRGRVSATADTNALVTVALTTSALLIAEAEPDSAGGARQHLRRRYDLCTTSLVVWQLSNAAGTLTASTGVIYSYTIEYQ